MIALVTAFDKYSNPGFADTFMPHKYVCKSSVAAIMLYLFKGRYHASETVLWLDYNENKRDKWNALLLNNTRNMAGTMRHFYQNISAAKASNKR